MRNRSIVHFFLIFAVAAVMLSCVGGERVIPPHKMAKIYVKMLLADQWVSDSKEAMDMADTSLLYEPILADAGYTKMDYVKSVNHYMDEPKEFDKIFDEVSDILGKRISEIEAARKARDYADSIRQARWALDIKRPEPFGSMASDSVRRDTVSIKVDSSGILVWERIMPDTTYYGPKFVLKSYVDSLLCVRDSLAQKEDGVGDKSVTNGKMEPVPIPVKKFPAPVKMDKERTLKATSVAAEPVLKMK